MDGAADEKPSLAPPKNDPLLWKIIGVPALDAYRDAYRVAQRIDRNCSQSIEGYTDGVRDARRGENG